MLSYQNDKNILLNQICIDQSVYSFKEIIPSIDECLQPQCVLTLNKDGNVRWSSYIQEIEEGYGISLSRKDNKIQIDTSLNLNFSIFDENKRIKETNIFYDNGRLGLGRNPLYNYKFDIKIPKNTLMTAFHVGDGKYGFSMGNGTTQGFIPEIIGMGSDENDPGLYFLGRAGIDISSNIPLIVFDGRSSNDAPLANRPVFGIKSGMNSDYFMIVDQFGKVGIGKKPLEHNFEVNGTIKAEDVILDSSISMKELINIIIEQKNEIDNLKKMLTELIKSS